MQEGLNSRSIPGVFQENHNSRSFPGMQHLCYNQARPEEVWGRQERSAPLDYISEPIHVFRPTEKNNIKTFSSIFYSSRDTFLT